MSRTWMWIGRTFETGRRTAPGARRLRATMVGLLAVGLTAAASGAWAQASPEDDSGLRMNCAGDYFRFCSAYAPGSVEIRQCFASNTERLTPECRGAIRAFDRRNSPAR